MSSPKSVPASNPRFSKLFREAPPMDIVKDLFSYRFINKASSDNSESSRYMNGRSDNAKE